MSLAVTFVAELGAQAALNDCAVGATPHRIRKWRKVVPCACEMHHKTVEDLGRPARHLQGIV
jgi:hypothetical protein